MAGAHMWLQEQNRDCTTFHRLHHTVAIWIVTCKVERVLRRQHELFVPVFCPAKSFAQPSFQNLPRPTRAVAKHLSRRGPTHRASGATRERRPELAVARWLTQRDWSSNPSTKRVPEATACTSQHLGLPGSRPGTQIGCTRSHDTPFAEHSSGPPVKNTVARQ